MSPGNATLSLPVSSSRQGEKFFLLREEEKLVEVEERPTSPRGAATMDFSALNEALAYKSYDKIADLLDTLMLQVASEGVAFHEEWPYVIHLLGHIYINDINNARFLWKKIPLAVKENQPEVAAVWKIGQRLWMKDYGGVHEAIREFNWSPQSQAIVAAFSG
ncbi:hypothetical protein CDL12_27492 [Handroanthus impetiginosus]|uniref:CSN8/PSMD8/EIF3K domain-containing protein n=1 Tax=Handroanthus impetiginosus TaxID=429701 RepID=A0A2G9G524_9LAMI|nr:hypothetical protein CDL12_27492 [Handroanthus impetiginosus]